MRFLKFWTWPWTWTIGLISVSLSGLSFGFSAFVFHAAWRSDSLDTIRAAESMGRLDFVSVSLTFLGLVALLAAFPFAAAMRQQARDISEEYLENRGDRVISDWLDGKAERVLLKIVEKHPQLISTITAVKEERDIIGLLKKTSFLPRRDISDLLASATKAQKEAEND